MNRKQLYDEITALGLQNEVFIKFGKNYTNCSNAELQAIVDSAHIDLRLMICKKPTKNSKNKLTKLVEILAKKKILLSSEVDEIMKS